LITEGRKLMTVNNKLNPTQIQHLQMLVTQRLAELERTATPCNDLQSRDVEYAQLLDLDNLLANSGESDS
jgi:hypothetical protein